MFKTTRLDKPNIILSHTPERPDFDDYGIPSNNSANYEYKRVYVQTMFDKRPGFEEVAPEPRTIPDFDAISATEDQLFGKKIRLDDTSLNALGANQENTNKLERLKAMHDRFTPIYLLLPPKVKNRIREILNITPIQRRPDIERAYRRVMNGENTLPNKDLNELITLFSKGSNLVDEDRLQKLPTTIVDTIKKATKAQIKKMAEIANVQLKQGEDNKNELIQWLSTNGVDLPQASKDQFLLLLKEIKDNTSAVSASSVLSPPQPQPQPPPAPAPAKEPLFYSGREWFAMSNRRKSDILNIIKNKLNINDAKDITFKNTFTNNNIKKSGAVSYIKNNPNAIIDFNTLTIRRPGPRLAGPNP